MVNQVRMLHNLYNSRYNNKAILMILCVVVIVLTIEISLVKNYNYTGPASVYTFIVIASAYIIGQYYILEFVGRKAEEIKGKKIIPPVIHKIVKILQYVLSILLVAVFLQMIIESYYYSIMLASVTYISYTTAVFMIGLLSIRFFLWFKSNKNTVVFLYGLASVSLAVNALLTLSFVTSSILNMPIIIRPNLQEIYYLPIPGSTEYLLNLAYTLSSIISFILTWIATALLLRSYSQKFGRIKYWVIISLPLVYFLSQFPSVSLNLFAPLLNSDPVFYGIVLSVIFNISKAAGGILFGVAFWTMTKTVHKDNIVRQYLTVAAVGFVLLFVADQAVVLVNAPYPPLGLASISFMGLASYLIFAGIYSSAISVSHDSQLRRSIRNFAIKETTRLLDSIGSAHMEQEIQKRVIMLTKRNQDRMAEESGIQCSLTEDDMKEYMEQVINEVKKAHQH
jgi:hypothetical protein